MRPALPLNCSDILKKSFYYDYMHICYEYVTSLQIANFLPRVTTSRVPVSLFITVYHCLSYTMCGHIVKWLTPRHAETPGSIPCVAGHRELCLLFHSDRLFTTQLGADTGSTKGSRCCAPRSQWHS